MARSWTLVRPVEEQDWSQVHALWEQARAEVPGMDSLGRRADVERVRAVLSGPGVRVLVAAHEDEVVGATVLTTNPLGGLTGERTMTVEMLYVTLAARGRGVGGQLLARAAVLAESEGVTQLVSTAPAGCRPANRFYARLGFSDAVTRRVAPTAALRRRLTPEVTPAAEAVLARRRSLRARAVAAGQRRVGALALGEAGRHAV